MDKEQFKAKCAQFKKRYGYLFSWFARWFSFRPVDVVGILVAIILILSVSTPQSLFYRLTDPVVYVILFFAAFAVLIVKWAIESRVYLSGQYHIKGLMGKFIKSFIRIVAVTLCTVGSYFLIQAVF